MKLAQSLLLVAFVFIPSTVVQVDGRRDDVRELVGIITEWLETNIVYKDISDSVTIHENENNEDDFYSTTTTSTTTTGQHQRNSWKYTSEFVKELISIRGYNNFIESIFRGCSDHSLTAHNAIESSTKLLGIQPLDHYLENGDQDLDFPNIDTNAGSGAGFQILCNNQVILNSGGGGGGAFDELHKEVSAGGGAGMQLTIIKNDTNTNNNSTSTTTYDFGGGNSFPYRTLTMDEKAINPTEFCHILNKDIIPILQDCYNSDEEGNNNLQVLGGGGGGGEILNIKNQKQMLSVDYGFNFVIDNINNNKKKKKKSNTGTTTKQ
ncbi:MAG: hypothetical protein ACI90V_005410 [Bacillariaceae sp.]|jgi:hypothetical protein